MTRLVFLALCALLPLASLNAETLSLDSCRARALRNNKQLSMAKVKKDEAAEENYATAMSVYDGVAEKYPQLKSWSLYQKANETFKAEMDEKALNLYNDVVNALENKEDRDRDENNYLATAYRNGGYILWSTKGDTDAARPYFEKLLKLDPENSLAKKFFEAEAAANAAAEEEAAATEEVTE